MSVNGAVLVRWGQMALVVADHWHPVVDDAALAAQFVSNEWLHRATRPVIASFQGGVFL